MRSHEGLEKAGPRIISTEIKVKSGRLRLPVPPNRATRVRETRITIIEPIGQSTRVAHGLLGQSEGTFRVLEGSVTLWRESQVRTLRVCSPQPGQL